MKQSKLLFAILVTAMLLWVNAQSQNMYLTGTITDTAAIPLSNASLVVKKNIRGNIIAYALSNSSGKFLIHIRDTNISNCILEASYMGYKKSIVELQRKDWNKDLQIRLQADIKSFSEVVIKSIPTPVVIRNDTIEYNAGSYTTTETRKVQDLFKNIPGFKLYADGRITYNDKPVEKILIDGTDLAGRQYGLVSRHLSAKVVDKIQVIDNYNDNPLMKEVINSEKIGVNLTIKKSMRTRISGTADAGTSFFKRNEFEANALSPGKVKMLGILNYNNTSSAGSADNSYYLNPDNQSSLLNSKVTSGVLSTGDINIPALTTRYTTDNKDYSGALMWAWPTARNTKYRAIFNYSNSGLSYLTGGLYMTMIDTLQWVQENKQVYGNQRQDIFFNTSRTRSSDKLFTQLDIELMIGRQRPRYENLISGTISDSLVDIMKKQTISAQLKYNYTYRIRAGAMFNISVTGKYEHSDEHLHANTRRFQAYFQLPSLYDINRQLLKIEHSSQEFIVQLVKKKDKISSALGASVHLETLSTSAKLHFASSYKKDSVLYQSPVSRRLTYLTPKIFSRLNFKTWGRSSVLMFLSGGAALTNGPYKNDVELIIRNHVEWQHSKIKEAAMRHIKVKYGFSRSIPDIFNYYAPGLVSGNATLLLGGRETIPEIRNTYSLLWSYREIITGNAISLHATASRRTNSFIKSFDLNPTLISVLQIPTPVNNQASVQISTERYFSSIKSKISWVTDYTRQKFTSFINGSVFINYSKTFLTTAKWGTAFKLPINVEAEYRLDMSAFIAEKKHYHHKSDLEIHKAYVKAKFNSGKFYAALLYNYYYISGQKNFTTFDLYASYTLNRQLSVVLNGHNLANKRFITDKSINSFSESISAFRLVERYFLFRFSYAF